MSWQAMVDSSLLGSGNVQKAAIIGLNGGVWATSAGFQVGPEEIKSITAGIAAKGVPFQTSGLKINGEKYMYLSYNEPIAAFKKGETGFVIYGTKTAFIIGYYAPPTFSGNAINVIAKLGDYLVQQGY